MALGERTVPSTPPHWQHVVRGQRTDQASHPWLRLRLGAHENIAKRLFLLKVMSWVQVAPTSPLVPQAERGPRGSALTLDLQVAPVAMAFKLNYRLTVKSGTKRSPSNLAVSLYSKGEGSALFSPFPGLSRYLELNTALDTAGLVL